MHNLCKCLCLRHLPTHTHTPSLSSPNPHISPPPPPHTHTHTHTGVCFQHLTLPTDHLNREPLLCVAAIQNGQDLSCCDGRRPCTGEPCGTGRKGAVALTSGAAGEDHLEGILQGREDAHKGNHIVLTAIASLVLRHPFRLSLHAVIHLAVPTIAHSSTIFFYSDVIPVIKVSNLVLIVQPGWRPGCEAMVYSTGVRFKALI